MNTGALSAFIKCQVVQQTTVKQTNKGLNDCRVLSRLRKLVSGPDFGRESFHHWCERSILPKTEKKNLKTEKNMKFCRLQQTVLLSHTDTRGNEKWFVVCCRPIYAESVTFLNLFIIVTITYTYICGMWRSITFSTWLIKVCHSNNTFVCHCFIPLKQHIQNKRSW